MDLKSFKSSFIDALPSAILSSLFTVLLLTVLLTVGDEETNMDSLTVVIEYNCVDVIMKPENFPEQVINECSEKMKFLVEPTSEQSHT
jgi:hypothetical protein